MNLKLVLMELGNKLVMEHGFDPAVRTDNPRNTNPIKDFTDWLNGCPEAQAILSTFDVEWPTAQSRATPTMEEAQNALIARKIMPTCVLAGRFPSGRVDLGVRVDLKRGFFIFFINGRKWYYEDYDGEGDCRETVETWMYDSALPESVAEFIEDTIRKREGP